VPTDPQQLWRASYAVTRLLAESATLERPLSAILQVIGREFSFTAGALWRVDYSSVLLRCVEFWRAAPDTMPQFEKVTRSRSFSIGEGLPGTVWQSRRPEWIIDIREHTNFPRASVARLETLVSGVATPVINNGRVTGVFEFFSSARREPESDLMDFLWSVGAQVGLYLDRLRVEEALTGAEAQFKTVAHAALDGIVTIDEASTILFVNPIVERIFGYMRVELIGQKLTLLMPDYLRRVHEKGIQRYLETGRRHISWDGIHLPGLHKHGHEIPLVIAFGEFVRDGRRIFSGYIREAIPRSAAGA
jgi:PAS domain S-box-containing protein